MGFTIPESTAPAEAARALMARKDGIEAEIEAQLSILAANGNATMNTPLVDREGFPRADLDVWAVRQARVRIIELRNDLRDIMDDIAKALAVVYAKAPPAPEPAEVAADASASAGPELQPFARVDGVAPGSPAAAAGLQRDDLVLKFGTLTKSSFTTSSLQPLAQVVQANENRALMIKVLRQETTLVLSFTPRQGWGGRGMLGCHIVPYSL
ncbi:hypothetical protein PUNSTDRAFT_97583 [Punctularia strigosozonata HHB-11173 SS5]|uniref:uncharacterized protein n=1 Tax=Punctularia strigosozonata (strain HHB-11173) TaxID=741275 RepID=UPI000441751F|nr:uncharacterized protein PUNSTDRAFT_97583 [Punctularia strigosozonata HHB-11173 SS5]EIN12741.1 hypothetical protein PUNSTDRAFT_97583 [Punctularia strigosozonata HHB-11173 SS5]